MNVIPFPKKPADELLLTRLEREVLEILDDVGRSDFSVYLTWRSRLNWWQYLTERGFSKMRIERVLLNLETKRLVARENVTLRTMFIDQYDQPRSGSAQNITLWRKIAHRTSNRNNVVYRSES